MATPKPGEIRCPTCHRSTPPAPFCTQCGSPIPDDARARPRGLDRDELQERIRARRSGDDPFRRGGLAGGYEDEAPGYERFKPEPEDASAARGPSRAGEPRVDHFTQRQYQPPLRGPTGAPLRPLEREEQRPESSDPRAESIVPPIESPWDTDPPAEDRAGGGQDPMAATAPVPSPAVPPAAAAGSGWSTGQGPAGYEAPPSGEWVSPEEADAFYDDDAEYAYDYAAYDEGQRGGSGAGAAIFGVLALGALAVVAGAFLAGFFGDGDPVADASSTPSAAIEITPEPTVAPTAAPTGSGTASGSPGATELPVTFPDGFVAETEPCIPGSANAQGCNSNGAQNNGNMWVWVGFENGTQNDVIGAHLLSPEGDQLAEGSIDLRRINCIPDCPGGWTYFPFNNLDPGEYTIRVTRNGDLADQTEFIVS